MRAPEALLVRATFLIERFGCSVPVVALVFGINADMLSKHVSRRRAQQKKASAAPATPPAPSAVATTTTATTAETTTTAALAPAPAPDAIAMQSALARLHRMAAPGSVRYHWLDDSASSAQFFGRLTRELANAAFALDCALFIWTDPRATAAVLLARQREVKVRILLDADESKVSEASDAAVIALHDGGVEVYLGFGRVIGTYMHTKFCVVDAKTVYMGSLSYSVQGFSDNVEEVGEDPNVASAEEFRARLEKWIARDDIFCVTESYVVEASKGARANEELRACPAEACARRASKAVDSDKKEEIVIVIKMS